MYMCVVVSCMYRMDLGGVTSIIDSFGDATQLSYKSSYLYIRNNTSKRIPEYLVIRLHPNPHMEICYLCLSESKPV